MAWKEGAGQPHYFVEEIDYNEIEQLEVVGKGSFGVVWKGKWRETYVAVKRIDSEAEKKAFAVEVRQLSRVSHPNIVKLYGACTHNPVCLVMEYAEGGSLYNVLHCRPLPKYTAGHAMSWALQCAKGVAYLHNMKPKALIHRDLKPPNLLLIKGGEVLKICDFGTACDKKTYMTNNKGSAAWMAPEVFEGSNYTEKCDVFSWGIILWEVLSRRKPFDDIGGSAFRIMWAVHTGERPPLINGCPKPIEELMTRCWDKNPACRPPMDEVVRIMSLLFVYFSGYDEPVQYSTDSSSCSSGDSEELQDEDCIPETIDLNEEFRNTLSDNQKPVFTPSMNGSHAASNPQMRNTKEKLFTPLSVEVDTDAWNLEESSPWLQNGSASESVDMEIRNMAGLDKVVFKPRPQVQRCPPSLKEQNASSRPNTPPEELDNIYIMLDPQLHPVTPDNSCQQSVEIFEQHKKLAQEYLKVQTEIAYLTRYMDQLAERLSEAEGLSQLDQQDTERHQEELRKLENEKKSLLALHRNLKQQLEIIKREPTNNVSDDGWVVLPNQEPSHIP